MRLRPVLALAIAASATAGAANAAAAQVHASAQIRSPSQVAASAHVAASSQVTASVQLTVRGRAVDAATGAPVPSAWAEVPSAGLRAGADDDGVFTLTVEPGVHRLRIHALGYRSIETDIEVRADTTIGFVLASEPIALEGIAVQADRLASRARAVPWAVRTVTGEEIAASAAATPVEVLTQRRIQITPCGALECVRWRGELIVPVVCIDERRAAGGLAELRTYPMNSLHVIEVHDRGRMIRAYTTWFMDRLRAGEIALRSTLPVSGPAC